MSKVLSLLILRLKSFFRKHVCYSQGAESITKTDGVGHRVSDPLCCEVRKHLQLWNHHKSTKSIYQHRLLGRYLAVVEAAITMPSVTCARLSLGDGGRRIYVRTEWLDIRFVVTALDFPQAWSCNGECVGGFLFSMFYVRGNSGFWVHGWRQERGAWRIKWNCFNTIFFEDSY